MDKPGDFPADRGTFRSDSTTEAGIGDDIGNKAPQKPYRDAATCLRRVFTGAGFDSRERVLIVPGNPDVGYFPKRPARFLAFLLAFYGETDVRLHVESPPAAGGGKTRRGSAIGFGAK